MRRLFVLISQLLKPKTDVLTALQIMADKNVGLLVALEGERLAGVVSERDCVRKVTLPGKNGRTVPLPS